MHFNKLSVVHMYYIYFKSTLSIPNYNSFCLFRFIDVYLHIDISCLDTYKHICTLKFKTNCNWGRKGISYTYLIIYKILNIILYNKDK
jgi:hypothetical protein